MARRNGRWQRPRPLAPCVGCGERFGSPTRDRDGLCGICEEGVRRDAFERLMRGEVTYGIGELALAQRPKKREAVWT